MAVSYTEHPEDVLSQWLNWSDHGPVALVMITGTVGGAVRAPGALMAVSDDGDVAGYISGGCIDADVVLQAQNALKDGKGKSLRYGAGSPFVDLPLPCGGAIELVVEPTADAQAVRACRDRLQARKPATLNLDIAGGVRPVYHPKLRLRIAGRGADSLALARIARASGIDTVLQLRDGEDVEAAKVEGFDRVSALDTPFDLPALKDDPYTAFILMFHDTDWETPLLAQAVSGPAFYVGAVGSSTTQARRLDKLRAAGLSSLAIRQVRGPIGLIPSMRDASMLAVSTLAEVVEAYHMQKRNALASTALVMLAAGQSSRFEDGDKLMAELRGKPVIANTANIALISRPAARIGVTAPDRPERSAELRRLGWQVVENPHAASGQASSLKAGIEAARRIPGVSSVLIMLADMPDVPSEHLTTLATQLIAGHDGVMSEADGVLCPPAIFADTCFEALCTLSGDTGAKSVFERIYNGSTVKLYPVLARDIDTLADLMDRMDQKYG